MPNRDEPTTRAAVYLRISQDKTGEAAGVDRQREDCINLVESQGWHLHDTYIDNDISASSGKPRPDYRRMLTDIKSGQIDAVVAWHPDRLYRKLTDLEELIKAIEARNVVMRTVRAGEIDLSTPTGRMLARILSATAQAEGEVKADRWRRSWRQGRERGQIARTGSRMFGYTREGQLIEAEATIARRMAADLLAGTSILGVTRWLQDEGVTTTRDTEWRPGTVRQYLGNPRIAAWSTLNGQILGEGNWEPILDRETWEAVRGLLESRTRTTPPRRSVLNGLIFCGSCGTRMVTSSQRRTRTYRCPKRVGFNGCGAVSGNADPIEDVVEAYAAARIDDPRVQRNIARLRSQPAGDSAEVAALELRLTELEKQLDEPGVPVATILRAIDRTKERQAQLLSQIAAAPVEIPTGGTPWPEDLRRRRALIELVVERVTLQPAARSGRQEFDPKRVEITRR